MEEQPDQIDRFVKLMDRLAADRRRLTVIYAVVWGVFAVAIAAALIVGATWRESP